MSYARSPRPSLVITMGIMCIRLLPWFKTDSWSGPGWRIGHREISAEIGHAAQGLERQARGREPELGRRVVGPGRALGVGAQQPGELGVEVGRPYAERVRHRQQPFRGDLLAAPFHLG